MTSKTDMTILRSEAKARLAKTQLLRLTKAEKLNILAEYWGYSSETDVQNAITENLLPAIPRRLVKLIATTAEPVIIEPDCEPLFLDFLIAKLVGVTNQFFESQLGVNEATIEVIGEVEPTGMCPCCEYYSIGPGEDGAWQICTVCFWENGGNGPNRMSLAEAKGNFTILGAMSPEFLGCVDQEGPLKYRR